MYKQKYLKYKQKYLELKNNMKGGRYGIWQGNWDEKGSWNKDNTIYYGVYNGELYENGDDNPVLINNLNGKWIGKWINGEFKGQFLNSETNKNYTIHYLLDDTRQNEYINSLYNIEDEKTINNKIKYFKDNDNKENFRFFNLKEYNNSHKYKYNSLLQEFKDDGWLIGLVPGNGFCSIYAFLMGLYGLNLDNEINFPIININDADNNKKRTKDFNSNLIKIFNKINKNSNKLEIVIEYINVEKNIFLLPNIDIDSKTIDKKENVFIRNNNINLFSDKNTDYTDNINFLFEDNIEIKKIDDNIFMNLALIYQNVNIIVITIQDKILIPNYSSFCNITDLLDYSSEELIREVILEHCSKKKNIIIFKEGELEGQDEHFITLYNDDDIEMYKTILNIYIKVLKNYL